MIPGKVVDLMKRVVVVGGGIERRHKGGAVDRQGLLVALGKEIVAVVRIGIADALGGGSTTPLHGSDGMEQALATDGARGHLLQVIGLLQIGAVEALWLQGTAIAVDFHFVRMTETSLTDNSIGQLVDAGGGHPDLGPHALGQHRVRGIEVGGTVGTRRG